MNEEQAKEEFGNSSVAVYHSTFKPLEIAFLHEVEQCYCKTIVDITTDNVLGFHIFAPNSAEIVQGFACSLQLPITKAKLDSTIGIHPTTAEELVQLVITKESGESAEKGGC